MTWVGYDYFSSDIPLPGLHRALCVPSMTHKCMGAQRAITPYCKQLTFCLFVTILHGNIVTYVEYIHLKPLQWSENKLRILDQTALPHCEVYRDISDYREVVLAIKQLQVRGAPAIGVAAAYGIALGAQDIAVVTIEEFHDRLTAICQEFAAARPTAVNLFHAIERIQHAAQSGKNISQIKAALIAEAKSIHDEEINATITLSRLGAELIRDGFTILTHCNAGPLATAGYGTALGVIRAACAAGKKVRVFADETRPLLQGARLTTWEMMQDEIPVTLITDSMAGYFLHRGDIDCVIVGADRIARNGDTANKIGTYSVAVLAAENKVPFYVAAPTSTIDLSLKSGAEIPIEERSSVEITHIAGIHIAPPGVSVANPAFDITPCRYITSIITEKGIANKPYRFNLIGLFRR